MRRVENRCTCRSKLPAEKVFAQDDARTRHAYGELGETLRRLAAPLLKHSTNLINARGCAPPHRKYHPDKNPQGRPMFLQVGGVAVYLLRRLLRGAGHVCLEQYGTRWRQPYFGLVS